MTFLVAAEVENEPAGLRFRRLVERPGILQLPGAYNGLSALQAKAAGFEALYLSGAAMSASMGLPDLGIISVDDVSFFIRSRGPRSCRSWLTATPASARRSTSCIWSAPSRMPARARCRSRTKLYVEAGADVIFPEALSDPEGSSVSQVRLRFRFSPI